MWDLIKNLYATILFLIGYVPKTKLLTPSSTNKNVSYDEELSLDTKPVWYNNIQKELLVVKAEAEKADISEKDLEKLISKFFNKELPAGYKEYLKNPVTNIGGDWIIITPHAFNYKRSIVLLALPIIAERLKPFNIRISERGLDGYLWVSATDITASLKPIEQADRKWLKTNTSHIKQAGKLLSK